jgi:hypothetical protein
MTITVPHPNTHQPTPVPYDIMWYCDKTTRTNHEDLKYIDCVWMHMGYYGTPPHIMKTVREKYFNRIPVHPIFD